MAALVHADMTLARALLQQSWPANAQADVHALALAAAKEATDLSSDVLVTENLANDVSTASADSQAVRADLGLPAATESPTS